MTIMMRTGQNVSQDSLDAANDGFVALQLFLAYEAGFNPNSYWRPYLEMLPTSFEGKPQTRRVPAFGVLGLFTSLQ
jgi:hypothetical protein